MSSVEEVNELWDVVRVSVIPTDEEKVECRNGDCIDQAVATWASNKDPEDKWDLCEKCQLEEMGGWPEGVKPLTHSTTSNNDGRVNNNDDTTTTPQRLQLQRPPQPTPVATTKTRWHRATAEMIVATTAASTGMVPVTNSSTSSRKAGQTSGRWTQDEHRAFLEGLKDYGREWKKVALRIPTRTSAQIRSHAQKYISKLQRDHILSKEK